MVGAVGAAGFFALLIVLVWQVAATWRAKMLASREEQYKQMTLKYQQLLEDNLELHRRSLDELSETRRTVSSVEKMMREIE
ncbi:YwqI/YxiC family protein [Streptomyces sp. A7024]|uniref:YwqI/YxiC family protein n=1 Tax=Streptomyces coryli TaxID=1128680 RepID=A0A6G4UCR9_9ACTN|nr:YwqI/YxiC family protein [Streptomyces coryli]NGN69510.1 YwqI/YxiC family protein [Streptomyces coryli]